MSRTEAQKQAEYRYRKNKVKRVALNFTLADFAPIASAASASGLPVNTYIKQAIAEKMERENAQK